MWNARLNESQGGIRIAGRNINNLRYVDDTTLMVEREEELYKELLDGGEREWKSWLKTQDSNKRRSWYLVPLLHGKRRKKMERVTDFTFLGFKITVDSDCSHEIKRACSLEGKLW